MKDEIEMNGEVEEGAIGTPVVVIRCCCPSAAGRKGDIDSWDENLQKYKVSGKEGNLHWTGWFKREDLNLDWGAVEEAARLD